MKNKKTITVRLLNRNWTTYKIPVIRFSIKLGYNDGCTTTIKQYTINGNNDGCTTTIKLIYD